MRGLLPSVPCSDTQHFGTPSCRRHRARSRHSTEALRTTARDLPDGGGNQRLLAAPDRSNRTGRRDAALFGLTVQTGLRASELIGLCCADVHLGSGAHVSCNGKGRKQRITPLTPGTVAVLRVWLAERAGLPKSRCSQRRPEAPSAGTLSNTGLPVTSGKPPPSAVAGAETGDHACIAALSRHAIAARRHRHLGDRALARP